MAIRHDHEIFSVFGRNLLDLWLHFSEDLPLFIIIYAYLCTTCLDSFFAQDNLYR